MSLNPNELTHLKPKLKQNKKNEGRHMSSNRSFGCGPNSNGNFQLNDETLSPPRPPQLKIVSVIPATPQKQLLNRSFNTPPLIKALLDSSYTTPMKKTAFQPVSVRLVQRNNSFLPQNSNIVPIAQPIYNPIAVVQQYFYSGARYIRPVPFP